MAVASTDCCVWIVAALAALPPPLKAAFGSDGVLPARPQPHVLHAMVVRLLSGHDCIE